MGTAATEIKRLQREIKLLKHRIAQLERGGNGKPRKRGITRKSSLQPRRARNENELVDEILRRAGLLAELTPEEKAMAAEWRALPEEEKERVQNQLWNLKLDPPLSQIIIENR